MSNTGDRGDNPFCFHRVAMENGREDLLVDPQSFREAIHDYLDSTPEDQDAQS